MAGLGLVQALDQYQQGVNFRQQQQEQERIDKQRAAIEEANQAAAGVLDASKAEWAANGAQGQYRPNSTTMFKAAEARGAALAKRGLWDHFMQNEAQIAPMRLKTRAEALQRYEADGDVEALARTVYPTIFDGKEIVGTERVEGAADPHGRPQAGKLKLKLSDGTSQEMDPQKMVQIVKSSLIDPQVTLKNEILLNFEREKARIHGDKEIRVIGARGAEDRKTDDTRTTNDRGLIDARAGHAKELAGINNTSREAVADTRAGATVEAAGLRGARGGGGGGPADQSKKVQRVFSGADGNVYAAFKDGTTRPLEVNGKPIASNEYSKRVDSLVKQLREAPGNRGKSEAELRSAAQEVLATPTKTAPVPGAGGAAKDYSSLWTK